MKIIEKNPFRVLGIISNSSAKETKESETFILRYLDIGKSADLKFDITPPLSDLERTSEIVPFHVPYDAWPGQYTVKITAGNDYVRKTTYRMITIV